MSVLPTKGLMRLHFRGSWPTTEFEKCRSRAVAALHPQVVAQCLRHTLPQRSGSSQRRSKIEELGPCEGKVEGGRVQTQHVCRDHQYPQAFHMCIDMYVGVCVCVCMCVCACVCVHMFMRMYA